MKWSFLDLLFPSRCVVCDGLTDCPGEKVCRKCKNQIVYIHDPYCLKCGKQLGQEEKEYCNDCERIRHLYVQGTALYDYGSMADSVFRFKYGGGRNMQHFTEEIYMKRRQNGLPG